MGGEKEKNKTKVEGRKGDFDWKASACGRNRKQVSKGEKKKKGEEIWGVVRDRARRKRKKAA